RREKFELYGFKSARHTRVRQRARLSNARLSICRLHVVSNANGGMPSVTLWFERRSEIRTAAQRGWIIDRWHDRGLAPLASGDRVQLGWPHPRRQRELLRCVGLRAH